MASQQKRPKLAIFQQEERDGGGQEEDDDKLPPPEVAPIPLPSSSSSSSAASAPMLSEMKRIRDNEAELQAYLKARPAALSPQDPVYVDSMPVESFGLAMLRGMGYQDDNNTSSQPCLLEGRPALLGLGAKIVHAKTSSSSSASAAAAAAAASGAKKHQHQRKYICNGSVCHIVGTHRYAVVKQTDGVPGLNMVKVECLQASGGGGGGGGLEELVLPKSALALQDLDQLPISHVAHSLAQQIEAAAHQAAQAAAAATSSSSNVRWIRPGLRVMVAHDKSPWFRKKGWIVSVNAKDKTCVVQFNDASLSASDKKEQQAEFKERHLQTTVEVGKRAVVLATNAVGVVESKDKTRALIRLDDAAEWHDLDDVCKEGSTTM